MFGHKSRKVKLPSEGKLRRQILNKEKEMAEGHFIFVNTITESYKAMLSYSVDWDIHFGDPGRREVRKQLKTVLEDLKVQADILQDSAQLGHTLTSALFQATREAFAMARVFDSVCKTGKFPKNWEDKLKMSDDIYKKALEVMKRVQRAFNQGVLPEVRSDVLDDLSHIYLNDLRDHADAARMRARH